MPETLIYLGSPYNHEDEAVRRERFFLNLMALGEILKLGFIPYSPIVHNHPLASELKMGVGWDIWQRHDLEILSRCDELWIYKLPGWKESQGLKAEIQFAEHHPHLVVKPYYNEWTEDKK